MDAMRAAAGEKVIEMQEADQIENTCGDLECDEQGVHKPVYVPLVEMTDEEVRLQDSDAVEESVPADNDVPELCDPDDDSDSESGDTFVGEDHELEELDALLNESNDSLKPQEDQRVQLRRSARTNAGVKRYDSD